LVTITTAGQWASDPKKKTTKTGLTDDDKCVLTTSLLRVFDSLRNNQNLSVLDISGNPISS
jgi:hypothetical protein